MIDSIQMLRFDYLKSYLLLPFLSLITVFVLPLRMYWNTKLVARYMYSRADTLSEATHLLIRGKEGNLEITELKNYTSLVNELMPEKANSLFLVSSYAFELISGADVHLPFH